MTAQFATGSQDGIRPLEQTLIRLFIVLNNVQCVQLFRIKTVPAQDLLREVTLKRGKAESSLLVMPEQKLDECIAQPANTIIEKNRTASGHRRKNLTQRRKEAKNAAEKI